MQQTIHSIDHNIPITDVTTLDDRYPAPITNQRFVAQLSTFFGLLAVFLSTIGIYGLMSYVVSRRTNEIGIRMALGAAGSNVSWQVMREIVLSSPSASPSASPPPWPDRRLVTSMLFGLHGTDPLSLTAAVLLLLIVATSAGYSRLKSLPE